MLTLGAIFAALAIATLINVLALIEGRSGTTPRHSRIFTSGMIGLLAMPVFIGSAFLMAISFIDATFKSAQGALFIISGIALATATVASLALQFTGRGSRSHA